MKIWKKMSWMFWILLAAAGCSIKPPEVRVTGEKTALEQEVIGTYRRLEEDTWMVASTRSEEKGERAPLSPEKKRVLDAYQAQKFNLDDVNEYKKKGLLGENNRGFLEIRAGEPIPNPEEEKLVQDLTTDENSNRTIIMDRVIELNESLKKADRSNVLAVFAEMNQKNSPAGTWIQDISGNWTKK
jgi:uncharacterized protein YdbL (DUF1318 family)